MNKKITVIVPVYNVESYLHECIDSILNQSFSEFELILIDDGSSDGSSELCDEYAKTDTRIRVLHQPNMGQSAARNNGVAEAKTDLVCFIDSDDLVNPFLLESFLQAMQNNNVGAVVCERIGGTVPPEDFFQQKTASIELTEINETTLLELLKTNNTIYWTLFPCLLKKKIYETYPLTPGRVMEDNAVTCKWLTEAKTIATIHTPLYFYRENPNGTMNSAFSEKRLDFLWALEEQLFFYESLGWEKLQGTVAKEYVGNARWLAARVKNELNDERLAKSVIKRAIRIRNRYADVAGFTEEDNRKLFKAAHPFFHRVKKRLHIK
ncbi:MAG: glycosyltransferase family 2 protein [Clostridia bacterium]|nr:glycosyltransferase family 2 protein [Clostridia bacterium]